MDAQGRLPSLDWELNRAPVGADLRFSDELRTCNFVDEGFEMLTPLVDEFVFEQSFVLSERQLALPRFGRKGWNNDLKWKARMYAWRNLVASGADPKSFNAKAFQTIEILHTSSSAGITQDTVSRNESKK